jgi:hypothetical protein
MELRVVGQLMKLREYKKKDDTIVLTAEVYVDGDRPGLLSLGLNGRERREIEPFVGKRIKTRVEFSEFNGRAFFTLKEIAALSEQVGVLSPS